MAGQMRDGRFDFRMGTIGQGLRVRPDTKAFTSGFRDSQNMHVRSNGEAVRRWGTWEREILIGETRLETWDFAEGDATQFLLMFSPGALEIKNAALTDVKSFVGMPWTADSLWFLTVTWEREKLVITDESFQPKVITYHSENGDFTAEDFTFDTIDGEAGSPLAAPFHEYVKDVEYTLTNFVTKENIGYGPWIAQALGINQGDFDLDNGIGIIRITSANYDLTGREGQHLRVGAGEIRIDGVLSGTEAYYTVVKDVAIKLDTDPMWTRHNSRMVEVAHFDHGLKPGDICFFYGIPDDVNDDGEATEYYLTNAPRTAKTYTTVTAPRSGFAGVYPVRKVNDKNHYEVEGEGFSDKENGLMGHSDCRVIALNGALRMKGIKEPVFSAHRGWPTACALHESRLWIGGSAQLPDAAFGSKFGLYRNFDMGEGNPTDAVQVLSIGQQARVRHLMSEFDLIVMCDKGEFYIPGSVDRAITQETVRVVSATEHGASYTTPVLMDGGVFFVDRVGRNIREMKIDNREEAYSAPPVSLVVPNWIDQPKHSTFFRGSVHHNTPLTVWSNLPDGAAITMHANRNEDFFGFMRWTMDDADFVCFASLSSRLFCVAKRRTTGNYFLLEFDTLNRDYVTTDFSHLDTLSPPQRIVNVPEIAGRQKIQIEAIPEGASTWQVYSTSSVYDDVSGTLTFPENVQYTRVGDSMTTRARFGPPNIATRGGSEMGAIACIVMAEIHWIETQTGYVHGEDIITPQEAVLFGPRGKVDVFKQYWPSIWDREPVLETFALEPGHFGLRMLNMQVKF
jgi:hypothetical protein